MRARRPMQRKDTSSGREQALDLIVVGESEKE